MNDYFSCESWIDLQELDIFDTCIVRENQQTSPQVDRQILEIVGWIYSIVTILFVINPNL